MNTPNTQTPQIRSEIELHNNGVAVEPLCRHWKQLYKKDDWANAEAFGFLSGLYAVAIGMPFCDDVKFLYQVALELRFPRIEGRDAA